MKLYEKYLIRPTDQFAEENFSSVMDEVQTINEKTNSLPSLFKPEIIISFLKDHSLQNEWINANPELTTLVSSGELFSGNIESLFRSSRNNPAFRQDLENYLTESFT